jgi:hypothetical protein
LGAVVALDSVPDWVLFEHPDRVRTPATATIAARHHQRELPRRS